jgi:hypothetical protein
MGVTILLIWTGAIGVTAAYLWFPRRRFRHDPFRRFRCPGCGQKVRYVASKAGRAALCPRCKQACTLPADPPTQPANDGYRIKIGQRLKGDYIRVSAPVRKAG